ncbi:MAG: ferritin [Bacteroidetes bacterium]|jgi:ferritin|nr:ferritin [Bacteroidota bacterium]
MINDKVLVLLNDQIELEAFSSFQYLSMCAWLEHQGYPGAAQFMARQADEEMMHMKKIFAYLTSAGGRAISPAIRKPQEEFDSFKDAFETALNHEKKVTEAIHNIVYESQNNRDFTTFNFMQWYVAEQLEEENLFATILNKIQLLEKDNSSFYHLDMELANLQGQTAKN